MTKPPRGEPAEASGDRDDSAYYPHLRVRCQWQEDSADGGPPYGDKTTEYPQDPGWWWWLGGWVFGEEKGHEWNVRLNWHYWTATHLADQSRAFLQAHWR